MGGFSYKGMTVVITGASSGFGEEFARQLAPLASRLILLALDRNGLDRVAAELQAAHPGLGIRTHAIDLADSAALNRFCDEITAEERPVHFLINNAGLGDMGRFDSADPAKLRRIFDVNVAAVAHLTRRILPLMPKSGNRAILNVGSLGGVYPAPRIAAYAASKAFVSSFTESLRIELRKSGIRVAAVCPGPVDTGFGAVASRKGTCGLPGPAWFKVDAATVAREGLTAVARGRARVFPGFATRMMALFLGCLPAPVFRRLMAWKTKL